MSSIIKIAQIRNALQQQQLGQVELQQKCEFGRQQAMNDAFRQAYSVDPSTGVPSWISRS